MSYEEAKRTYAAMGIDTDAAIAKLKTVLFPCTAGREMTSGALTPIPASPSPAAFRPLATIPAGQNTRGVDGRHGSGAEAVPRH